MNRRKWVLAALVALLPPAAEADLAMHVEGLTGGLSRLPDHVGWFPLEGMTWTIDPASAASAVSISVTLRSSAAIASLLQITGTGTARKVVVDQMHAIMQTPQVTARLTCESATIGKVGAVSGAQTMELVHLTLECRALAWDYYDYGPTGTMTKRGSGHLALK